MESAKAGALGRGGGVRRAPGPAPPRPAGSCGAGMDEVVRLLLHSPLPGIQRTLPGGLGSSPSRASALWAPRVPSR